MITFAYPKILLLLLAVPLYLALYFWARWARRRNLALFGKHASLKTLAPEVSPYKPPVKLVLRMLVFTMLVIAAARPWGGVTSVDTKKQGIEVIIAVDASNSMRASSTDSPDGIDRMRMAKLGMERLIDRLGNDRVGLVVYAGEAYTLIPVTNDYTSAKMFLNSIDPEMLQVQGTDMAAAIRLAASSFSDNKNVGKAIILITDAEELEDESGVMQTVEDAGKNKIQVDVMGVGSTSPVTIPDARGNLMTDPDNGEVVRTRLNEDLAIEIAKAGHGIYVNAANKNAVSELAKQLDRLQKTSLESSFLAVHQELFPIFVWIALVLLLADLIILDSKMGWLDRFTFFKKETNGK